VAHTVLQLEVDRRDLDVLVRLEQKQLDHLVVEVDGHNPRGTGGGR
jgi:hypothetical protein